MRRHFIDILKENNINLKDEYNKLWKLFHSNLSKDDVIYNKTTSLYSIINEKFYTFSFRGTCLSLDEFDQQHNIHFDCVYNPDRFNIDYFVSFCEYIYNLIIELKNNLIIDKININNYPSNLIKCIDFLSNQIERIIELIGYHCVEKNGCIIFVEKSPAAIVVSELLPKELSYKVISYNHYSLSGNLEAKRESLLQFSKMLEPKREILGNIDREFTSDLFYLFNNLNLRHNNIDPQSKENPGKKYKQYVAEMLQEQLEFWYDEIYQMCLLAILRIEQNERKKKINELKKSIEANN